MYTRNCAAQTVMLLSILHVVLVFFFPLFTIFSFMYYIQRDFILYTFYNFGVFFPFDRFFIADFSAFNSNILTRNGNKFRVNISIINWTLNNVRIHKNQLSIDSAMCAMYKSQSVLYAVRLACNGKRRRWRSNGSSHKKASRMKWPVKSTLFATR